MPCRAMSFSNVTAASFSIPAACKTFPQDPVKSPSQITRDGAIATANAIMNTTEGTSASLWKTAKITPQVASPRSSMGPIDDDVSSNYYSFCPDCGVDILVFSYESYCPMSDC
ncbi:hypothetical protein CU097_013619 [Rhizopus azygosporus]|uniref:Uncharacterized protein n=1 Tax=Rhizopus azygosporus TaxID=86630 RepID=A0A367K118_RHIAZ|nr:hypothetical protein CU097_013619 [Rhizopus azygosporus]